MTTSRPIDADPNPDRHVIRSTIRCPSGGVVVMDAGRLMAASPEELASLQARLHAAAGRTTPGGRPFRSTREDTQIGPVFVAPVAARAAPHIVQVVREDGRPARMVIDLDGPDPANPVAAEASPDPEPLSHHAEGPQAPPRVSKPVERKEGEGSAGTGSGVGGLCAAVIGCMLAFGLVAAGCGDTSSPAAPATGAETPTPSMDGGDASAADVPTAGPTTRGTVYPSHYLTLAKEAADQTKSTPVRVKAIEALSLAGPHGSLVMPTLRELAERADDAAIRDAASKAIERLLEVVPERG